MGIRQAPARMDGTLYELKHPPHHPQDLSILGLSVDLFHPQDIECCRNNICSARSLQDFQSIWASYLHVEFARRARQERRGARCLTSRLLCSSIAAAGPELLLAGETVSRHLFFFESEPRKAKQHKPPRISPLEPDEQSRPPEPPVVLDLRFVTATSCTRRHAHRPFFAAARYRRDSGRG